MPSDIRPATTTGAPEVDDLIAFLDASPTPYHAVAEAARRLEAAGYRPLSEQEGWRIAAGDRCYVTRGDGSIIAFEAGSAPISEAGLRIVAAHTDSPNLRLKPSPDVKSHGYRQVAVEPYGGVLLHTWLDRDLGIAGRVSVAAGADARTVLVDIRRAVARIPSLAIHLHREIRTEGLKINEQTHLPPITGMESGPALAAVLAAEIDCAPDDIVGFDLMFYDLQGAAVGGVSGDFVFSGRLDNLASSHAAVASLVRATEKGGAPFTRIVALHDHEEVGSRSAHGAGGTFLLDVVERLASLGEGASTETRQRAIARSMLVSADVAHAVHPNHAERHEPGHRPLIGSGPVLKFNAGLSYATDATTQATFASVCRRAGVAVQHFVTRSDIACGSTIGPITAARVGLRTVDVGIPVMSMHSSREMCGTADVAPMIRALATWFEAGD